MTVRIATRGSPLALAQAHDVATALRDRGVASELVVVRTAGDADQTRSFAAIGRPGIFVREVQRAVLSGDADLAVHSYKDLPVDVVPGLTVAAVPERASPEDWLLVHPDRHDPDASGLPLAPGARVGTSAVRRAAQIRALRDDVVTAPLRGNVGTRVQKLLDGAYDAIVVAAAGVERLRRADAPLPSSLVVHALDPRVFVPAPSQGAIAVETRDDAPDNLRAHMAALDHAPTRRCVTAERVLLARLEGGCSTALGAWSAPNAKGFSLVAWLDTPHGPQHTAHEGADPNVLAARAASALASHRELPA